MAFTVKRGSGPNGETTWIVEGSRDGLAICAVCDSERLAHDLADALDDCDAISVAALEVPQ